MTKSVTVSYGGVDFIVTGEYSIFVAANFMEPPEGGGFDEYQVFIGEYDVTDLLCDDVIQYILDIANDTAANV
jgi:hypothetical protein